MIVSGGQILDNPSYLSLEGSQTASCAAYDIKNNTWLMALPQMEQARRSHSTCTVGGQWIYAIAGYNQRKGYLSSVERFNAKRYFSLRQAGEDNDVQW